MSKDEARLIAERLGRLAEYAPTGEIPLHSDNTRRAHLRASSVVAVSVASVLLIGALALVVTSSLGRTAPLDAGDHGLTTDPTSLGSPAPSPMTGHIMEFSAVADWPRDDVATCGEWLPGSGDSVLVTADLDPQCIASAPRDATTVFLAPYQTESVFGGSWEEQTDEWRQVRDHALRRLARGPLAEMSSRYVDAVVCRTCDQVAVVVGPSPTTVREIVESVQD